MKVILTSKEEFASKAGQDFVKLHYLSLNGQVGEALMTKEKYLLSKVDENKIASKDTLKQIEEISDVVDVAYDKNGRIVEIVS